MFGHQKKMVTSQDVPNRNAFIFKHLLIIIFN